MEATSAPAGLRADVEGHQWYHTLELAPGLVTPGWFDTRALPTKLSFPDSLKGQRCLDVGTFDGFWAFDMERRGADEVMAIDLVDVRTWDWPAQSPERVIADLEERKRAGSGFELARRALGSQVERRIMSVYDLDPDDVGQFDFIFLGSLLLHLRDPILALERVRRVTRGQLIVMDVYDPVLSLLAPKLPLARLDAHDRPWWWQSNIAALVRMLEAAGFALEGPARRILVPAGGGQAAPPISLSTLRSREGRQSLRNARRGDPHVVFAVSGR